MATFDLFMPPIPVPFFWVTTYTLDGTSYVFEYTYNDRAGFWHLNVGNISRVAQVFGVKLNLGTDKLRPYKYATIPPGSLDVIDRTDQHDEPTIADFGERVVLRYTEFEEPPPPPQPQFITPAFPE